MTVNNCGSADPYGRPSAAQTRQQSHRHKISGLNPRALNYRAPARRICCSASRNRRFRNSIKTFLVWPHKQRCCTSANAPNHTKLLAFFCIIWRVFIVLINDAMQIREQRWKEISHRENCYSFPWNRLF